MKRDTLKKSIPWIAVIGLGLILRAALIGRLGTLWFDEAFSWHFARMPLGRMLELLRYDVHPPLHAAVLNLWMRFFGDGVTAMRALSLVFAAAGLATFAALGRRLFDKKAAFLATTLAALSPLMIYYGADGRMYALIFFLSCLSSLAFLQIAKSGRPSTFGYLWFWSSLALVLTHATGALVVVAQALYLLKSPERRGEFKRLLPRFIILGLAFSMWMIPAALARFSTIGGEWQFRPTEDGARPWQALLYWAWITGNRAATAVFGLATALLILAGVMRHAERRPHLKMSAENEYLLIWLACCFLPFLPLAAVAPRYLMAVVPPFLLLLAHGFMNAGKGRRLVLLIGLAAVALFSFPGITAQLAARPYNWEKNVDWISERWQEGDRVVFNWFASQMAFEATAAAPFSRDLSAFDMRGLYPFDDDYDADERLVRHAGTLTLIKEDFEKLGSLMDGAERVFFIPNLNWSLADGGSSSDALNAWFLENGWYLADYRDREGRTDGVWLMVKK